MSTCSSSSGVSMCTFVPVSRYFCTSNASEHLHQASIMRRTCRVHAFDHRHRVKHAACNINLIHHTKRCQLPAFLPRLLRCQYLYFSTSKASKLSTSPALFCCVCGGGKLLPSFCCVGREGAFSCGAGKSARCGVEAWDGAAEFRYFRYFSTYS